MTTIAAEWCNLLQELHVACDSFVSGNAPGAYCKFHRYKRGVIMLSGDWDEIAKLEAWAKNGGDPNDDDITYNAENASAYVFTLENKFEYLAGSNKLRKKINSHFIASGSGAPYAIAALHNYISPADAVRTACAYDPGSKLPIIQKKYKF